MRWKHSPSRRHRLDDTEAPMGMKEEFAKGCRDSGGSFVENNDGTFQCNTTSGLVIRCQDDGSKCWIPVRVAPGVHIIIDVEPKGINTLLALPEPT
jgi:hypothetical protein